MTLTYLAPTIRSKHIKGSNECLFIMTDTQSAIFRVIAFVKLLNDISFLNNSEWAGLA